MDSGSGSASASASASATNSATSPITRNLDKEPLWKYVTITEKLTGGSVRFVCSICNNPFCGSGTRVRLHLFGTGGQGIRGCEKVSPELVQKFRKEVNDANAKHQKDETGNRRPQPISQSRFAGSGSMSSKRQNTGPIEAAFNNEIRAEIDSEIAKTFFSAGCPFNLARNPHFLKFIKLLANNNVAGYTPPSYDTLRTTLLAKERAMIERKLGPIKETWAEKGVSIVSDGWGDPQSRPLYNFIAVSEGGPMFLKAVNCEGKYKDKVFLANLLKEVIMEVGPQNVVQVVTDNAPVCKAAGAIIESSFPHIFWTPCVVHTLNLALQNICAAKNTENNEIVYGECHWITEVVGRATQIRNFVMNHTMRMAMYQKFAPLTLLSVAQIRFASMIVVLKRFKLMKRALELMVLDEAWSSYREDDPDKASAVKLTILDELWWDKVNYILDFTDPIYDMIRRTDTDKPCLHLVYDMWDTMIEKVKNVIYKHEKKETFEDSNFYEVVHGILVDRWNKSTSPLHCLAHSLNPRYYSHKWLNEAPNRVPPHRDSELSEERNKCLRRMFPDDAARAAVNVEFARFSGSMDVFGQSDSLADRGIMDPKMWWCVHGSSAPNLQNIASRLLVQPCSSSCAERNWSTYSFIHSLKRNKILPSRAENLVFVHNNLRLLSRQSEQYYEGATKLWDIGGDGFEPLDGAEELEIADLSLDVPELEEALLAIKI